MKTSQNGINLIKQFDALVSFAFNIGNIDQLTANGTRDVKTISQKMLQYNKAAGKTLDGLTKRRKAEQELFLKTALQNIQAASTEPAHIQLNISREKNTKPPWMACASGQSAPIRIRPYFRTAESLEL